MKLKISNKNSVWIAIRKSYTGLVGDMTIRNWPWPVIELEQGKLFNGTVYYPVSARSYHYGHEVTAAPEVELDQVVVNSGLNDDVFK